MEYHEGSSHKFWEVQVDGSDVTTRWGRVGTKGQSKTKPHPDPESARRDAEKQAKKKLTKGYVEIPSADAPPAPSPVSLPPPASPDGEPWHRVVSWLAHHARAMFDGLPSGADDAAISELEGELGHTLPSEARAMLQAHDGSDAVRVIEYWSTLSVRGILEDWKGWCEFLGDDDCPEEGTPNGPVKPAWWSPHWVPIATNHAGDCLVLDFDPAAGGVPGQVVEVWHDEAERLVLAPSWKALLERYADDLVAGRFAFSAEEGWLEDQREDSAPYGIESPPLPPVPPQLLDPDTAPEAPRRAPGADDIVVQVGDSLGDVIQAAPEGATVWLAAGTHRLDGEWKLERSLTFVGEQIGRTVLEGTSTDDWFLVTAGTVVFEDLFFRRLGPKDAAADVLAAAGGTLEVRRCRLGGATAYDNSGGCGMRLWGEAQGSIRDSLVEHNDGAVTIRDTARGEVEGIIARHHRAGIYVWGESRARVVGCQVEACQDHGIGVFSDAEVDVLDNVTRNTNAGIFASGQVRVRVVGNHASKCRAHGLAIGPDNGSATVENNRSHLNGENGIMVWGNSTVTVASNHCASNGRSGLAWVGTGNGTVRANKFEENGEHALHIEGDAEVDIEGNHCVAGATGAAVVLMGQCVATVRDNHCVAAVGVALTASCRVTPADPEGLRKENDLDGSGTPVMDQRAK
ncbi:MAG TPA: right-handed parallel beta-helix repeat-containing protein [Myxococcota bacterium]|nr:right-handed parallel beta-helix repeat-containing protein [Myxococcota bacterium]